MRCQNQKSATDYCLKPIPEDCILYVQLEDGKYLCGDCVDRALFTKIDSELDSIGRFKGGGTASRKSAHSTFGIANTVAA